MSRHIPFSSNAGFCCGGGGCRKGGGGLKRVCLVQGYFFRPSRFESGFSMMSRYLSQVGVTFE